MTATIITIGDELLIGQTIDTNSAFIAQQFNAVGLQVHERIAVGDTAAHIIDALNRASKQSEVVIITGGLGPTKDDITKQTLCSYFGVEEVLHEPTFERLKVIFEKRGKEIIEINKKQAMLPANCTVLTNDRGTAPGMWFDVDRVVYASLPGVPFEMKHLMLTHVLPMLQKRFTFPSIIHRNLMTVGIGESSLSKLLTEFENQLPEPLKLAYLPDLGIVKLRLSGYGERDGKLDELMNERFKNLQALCVDYSYADYEVSLEQKVGELLLEQSKRFVAAESCTGGYLGHLVTAIPGSSRYFEGSTVTYSYEMKKRLLGVHSETLEKHGAVSEKCVSEMLEGLLKAGDADLGVAISGIAGPDGGTPEKPVGTVCFAVGDRNRIVTQTLHFFPGRMENIRISAITALNLVRKFVLNKL